MAENDGLDNVLSNEKMTDDMWDNYKVILKISDSSYSAFDNKRMFFNSEIRHAYGHSVANPFRNEYEPDYEKIVKGVAKKLKIPIENHHTWYEIEEKIIARVIDIAKARIIKEKGIEEWKKIEEEVEKEIQEEVKSGKIKFATAEMLKKMRGPGLIAAIIGGRMGGFLLYIIANKIFFKITTALGIRIGVAVAGPIIGRVLSTLLGPAGWILTGILVVYDLGNTNWKKVIPSVVTTAMFRRQFEFGSEF